MAVSGSDLWMGSAVVQIGSPDATQQSPATSTPDRWRWELGAVCAAVEHGWSPEHLTKQGQDQEVLQFVLVNRRQARLAPSTQLHTPCEPSVP